MIDASSALWASANAAWMAVTVENTDDIQSTFCSWTHTLA